MVYFDNLEMCVAISFDVRDEVMNEQITNDINNEGVVSFNELKNSKINSFNMRKHPTVIFKIIDLIVYLII